MQINSNTNPRQALGKSAEVLAAQWLTEHGAIVLVRNYRVKGGEIDLVVEWGIDLVFVEVRARISAGRWVRAEETVTFPKQLRIERAARQFLQTYRGRATGIRFDVLAWDGRSWIHLPRAWR